MCEIANTILIVFKGYFGCSAAIRQWIYVRIRIYLQKRYLSVHVRIHVQKRYLSVHFVRIHIQKRYLSVHFYICPNRTAVARCAYRRGQKTSKLTLLRPGSSPVRFPTEVQCRVPVSCTGYHLLPLQPPQTLTLRYPCQKSGVCGAAIRKCTDKQRF